MVDSVSVRFKNAHVEKMLLNIRIQWNAGTACVSECVLKTLACRGSRVGPSKSMYFTAFGSVWQNHLDIFCSLFLCFFLHFWFPKTAVRGGLVPNACKNDPGRFLGEA